MCDLSKENKRLISDCQLLEHELKFYFKEALKNKQKLEKVKVFADELYIGGDNKCAEIAKENQEELNKILDDGYEWKEGTRKLNKLLDSKEKK